VVSVDPAAELYGVALDRFVPERAALAKALRGEGRREEAARVAALRKPTVAAWAVNQLVRTQRRAVAELLDAGDALSHAQSELLAGRGGAQTLREATARQRSTVEELLEAARGLLTADGHDLAQATIDRVADTLRAATLDEDARAQLRDGCLTRELQHAGIGDDSGFSVSVSTSAGRGRKGAGRAVVAAQPGTPAKPSKRDVEDRDCAVRAQRQRAEELTAASEAEAAARRAAERAARELAAAHERRERAADLLRDADDALAAASQHEQEAQLALRSAQVARDRL
jgi:hypothetical protein